MSCRSAAMESVRSENTLKQPNNLQVGARALHSMKIIIEYNDNNIIQRVNYTCIRMLCCLYYYYNVRDRTDHARGRAGGYTDAAAGDPSHRSLATTNVH